MAHILKFQLRILYLSLFHKFVGIRTCGFQRTPDVVFSMNRSAKLWFRSFNWRTGDIAWVTLSNIFPHEPTDA